MTNDLHLYLFILYRICAYPADKPNKCLSLTIHKYRIVTLFNSRSAELSHAVDQVNLAEFVQPSAESEVRND